MFERKYPNFVFSNLGQRFIAFIIDMVVIWAIMNLLGSIGQMLGLTSPSLSAIVHTVVYLAYFLLTTKLSNGYTLGKAIMGLRVVSFNEDVLSWPTVITREVLAGFVMRKLVIFYILPLFTDYRQNLGDLLADTSVLKESYLAEVEDYLANLDDRLDDDDYQQISFPVEEY